MIRRPGKNISRLTKGSAVRDKIRIAFTHPDCPVPLLSDDQDALAHFLSVRLSGNYGRQNG